MIATDVKGKKMPVSHISELNNISNRGKLFQNCKMSSLSNDRREFTCKIGLNVRTF